MAMQILEPELIILPKNWTYDTHFLLWLIHQLSFNLFECFAFGFRNTEFDKQKAGDADCGKNPECVSRSDGFV